MNGALTQSGVAEPSAETLVVACSHFAVEQQASANPEGMPVSSDRDVFRRFTEGGTSREIALLAFASYAEAKYDWEAQSNAPAGPELSDRV